jgi:site-specific recombinase
MIAVKYILNFFIIFCLAAVAWLKTVGISIESKERIWGRPWMHISDNPTVLVFLAIIFLILRLMIGQTLEKRG